MRSGRVARSRSASPGAVRSAVTDSTPPAVCVGGSGGTTSARVSRSRSCPATPPSASSRSLNLRPSMPAAPMTTTCTCSTYAPRRLMWRRPASPHAHAPAAGAQGGHGAGRVVLPVLLPRADQVDVDDGRAAVPLLEVGVDEAHALQIQPADCTHAGVVEARGQPGLQVHGVALLHDLHGGLAVEDHGILVGVRGARPAHVDVAAGVDGLLDPGEALVVTHRLRVDPPEVLVERRRVSLVDAQAVTGGAVERGFGRVSAVQVPTEKEVADIPVVPAVDDRVAGDLGAVRDVVRRGAVHHALPSERAAQEVVHERAALAEGFEGHGGREDVVVDEIGPVTDLDEQVPVVRVVDVARDAGALRLPVQPGAERTVVNTVVPDHHVDGRVQLDAADLVAVELPLDRDAVDVVVLDRREDTSQVPDDAVLAAVVDGVAADHVRSDVFGVPSDVAGREHGLELVLVPRLVATSGRVVVPGGRLLPDRDRRALRVVDDVVLDDPALRPVGADQAWLVGGGRGPGAGRLRQLEAAHGDVVQVVLARVEHGAPDVDLDQL